MNIHPLNKHLQDAIAKAQRILILEGTVIERYRKATKSEAYKYVRENQVQSFATCGTSLTIG